jgi:hypothetical protein
MVWCGYRNEVVAGGSDVVVRVRDGWVLEAWRSLLSVSLM